MTSCSRRSELLARKRMRLGPRAHARRRVSSASRRAQSDFLPSARRSLGAIAPRLEHRTCAGTRRTHPGVRSPADRTNELNCRVTMRVWATLRSLAFVARGRAQRLTSSFETPLASPRPLTQTHSTADHQRLQDGLVSGRGTRCAARSSEGIGQGLRY